MSAKPHNRWATRTLQGRRWLVEQRLDAVESNAPDQLRDLLSYQIRHSQRELTTALQIAVLKKSDDYTDCVEILVSHGADPNGTTGTGTPFLCLAADAGCHRCLQLLLGHGADVNGLRDDGATALHRASMRNNVMCIKELLSSGANQQLCDSQGRTPLLLAAQVGHPQAAEMLLRAGSLATEQDAHGKTALHWATEHDDLSLLKSLTDAGSDPNIPDSMGRTPLMIAAELGHHESLNFLLQNGAKKNAVDRENVSSITLAARGLHVLCVLSLIDNGCEVNSQGDETALGYFLHKPEVALRLIIAGADVSKPLKDGDTPLQVATERDQQEMVKLLLQANCDLDYEINYDGGRHPLQIALYRGYNTTTKYIFHTCLIGGVDLSWLPDYIFCEELEERGRENKQTKTSKLWLEEQLEADSVCLTIAQTLMNGCRLVIREELGSRRLFTAVDSLPLPSALKDYLKLCELDVL